MKQTFIITTNLKLKYDVTFKWLNSPKHYYRITLVHIMVY